MNKKPKLSVVVIAYDMVREIPKTLQSLAPTYQVGIEEREYEVLLIDNGSPERLDADRILASMPNISLSVIDDAPASPALAINRAISSARGEIICLMIDGAHILTPKVLHYGLAPFSFHPNPIVSTLPFFLGPGEQPDTVQNGYTPDEEDRLLERIKWPEDGYRLFEIGVPYRYHFKNGPPKLYWFVKRFESNCLFFKKQSFLNAGGCDLRFDIAGGGCLLPDLCRELGELSDAGLFQILGEASFHQVHGGVSTSKDRKQQEELWQQYTEQYKKIRGRDYQICQKPLEFIGHMNHKLARLLMLTG